MERAQFTFYRSYYEAIRQLPKKEQATVLLAICAYALDEKPQELTGVAGSVFTLIKPTLDTGRRKAENRENKRRTNEEQTENKTGTSAEQTKNKPITNEEQISKEGEIEREVERDREIEIENECSKESKKEKADKTPKPTRHKYGQYGNVLLTDEELKKLKREFPDWNERIERLSEYMASTGRSYKSHLATIRAWARKDGTAANSTKPIQKVQHHDDELSQIEKDAVAKLLQRQGVRQGG